SCGWAGSRVSVTICCAGTDTAAAITSTPAAITHQRGDLCTTDIRNSLNTFGEYSRGADCSRAPAGTHGAAVKLLTNGRSPLTLVNSRAGSPAVSLAPASSVRRLPGP